MNQIATKLYDAQLCQQVNYCMNAAAEYYSGKLAENDPFLLQRGISYETAIRFKVGRADGKRDLLDHLLNLGISEEISRTSGLINKQGYDYFQDHIVFPIYLGEQVVDFIGRYLGDNSEYSKYWRLSNDRVVTGESHFNWDMNRTEVILTEGVMDALSLIQNGFDDTVAIGGTNGLNEMLLRRSVFTGLKKVWICFDADKAGMAKGLAAAYKLLDMGLKAKIIELPDGLDPNDFFMTNSAEDFRKLFTTAVMPEHYAVSQIPDDWDTTAKIEALEDVLLRITSLPAMTQSPLIDLIAAKTGISKKDIRTHLSSLEQPEANTLDYSICEEIHPALHFGTEETLVTYPFLGEQDWEPWVISSKREVFRLTKDELKKRGYFCKDLLFSDRRRFSTTIVQDFLAGRDGCDMSQIFNMLRHTFTQYCDFEDPNTYDYLTAWTIGTYYFPLFNYYPYIHFTGTKEVGKSKTIKLMSLLCWNGRMSVSMSDAGMFRIISQELPTLFLDESENLADKTYSERRALLLGGYEKGTEASRVEKVNGVFEVKNYHNYCPRVFGSIGKMDDVLASRSIQIVMSRSFNDTIKETEVDLLNERFQAIRDELFLAVMTYAEQIKTIYEQIDKRPNAVNFDSREWNLFKPIYTVGSATGDPSIISRLIDFANNRYAAKIEAMNDSAVENVILRFLLNHIQDEGVYGSKVLHRELIDFIRSEGINVGEVREDHFGVLLHQLQVCEKLGRKTINGERQTQYLFNPERVKLIAKNYKAKKD